MDWGARGSGDRRGALRIGGPLASEMATYPLPVAAVARVAPQAAVVAALVQEHPAAAISGADLDPAQLRGCQELGRRLRHGPQGAIQRCLSFIPGPVPAPTVGAISGHYAQMRECDRELSVERREVVFALGFAGDVRRDQAVDLFSEGDRPRECILRSVWVQRRLPKEILRLLRSKQTSLSGPVEQVLIGAEVLAVAVGETRTHGIDEVKANNAAPELESPLWSVAAHVRLPVSNRLHI
jgi:hypothetical protein